MMTPADLMPLVLPVVLAASRDVLRAFRSEAGREVLYRKRGNKPVTRADLRAGEALHDGLRGLIPGAGFVAAEFLVEGRPDAPTWFLDPIDGTRAFCEGSIEFAVSVGLAVGGRPVLGVVVQPAAGRAWTGVVRDVVRAGGRARLLHPESGEARDLRVAPFDGYPGVDAARLVLSRTAPGEVLEACAGAGPVSFLSSCALKMVAVASGDADLFVGSGSAWDTCAGEAILLAAGNLGPCVASCDGEQLDYSRPGGGKHPRGVIAARDPRLVAEAIVQLAAGANAPPSNEVG